MAIPQGFEIVGVNSNWAVYLNGRFMRDYHTTHDLVVDAVHAMAKRLAPRQARPCLCCNAAFLSEGPHNRLCNSCRGKT